MKIGTPGRCARSECMNLFLAKSPKQRFCSRQCQTQVERTRNNHRSEAFKVKVTSVYRDAGIVDDLKFLASDEGVSVGVIQRRIVTDWFKCNDVLNGVPNCDT